mgnify:FL=1
MKTILFSGGGTLGHVLPNMVIIEKLKRSGYDVCYVGSPNSMEEKTADNYGVKFYQTTAVKLDKSRPLSNVKIPFLLPASIHKTKKILEEVKPDLVFTKGGYVSLPVVISAKMLNIPQICHESDASLGIVNQIAYRLGATVLTSNNCSFDKGIKVGIPLKPDLFTTRKARIMAGNKPTILVTGGSQGAKSINDFMLKNCDEILKRYNLIIIGGKTLDLTIKKPGLTLVDFTSDMGKYYASCDVVVSRAGATTIAEIIALNKKAILIPLPSNVSRGDQQKNAKNVESSTIKVLPQSELTLENLLNLLQKLQNTTVKEQKYENPVDKIYDEIVKKL